jgi:hypothetical protein
MKVITEKQGPKLSQSIAHCDDIFMQFMTGCDHSADQAFKLLLEGNSIENLALALEKVKATNNEHNRIEGICEASS